VTESWRCFVAVPVGEDLRTKLASAVAEWRRRPDVAGLRWSDPESWHLTIAFLGEVPAADVPRLAEGLDVATDGHEATELRMGGVGGFPSASRARVAWYGVADPSERLRALAADVRRALALPDAGPFRGHVTLARARSAPVDLHHWVASARPPDASLPLARVELMRSHLGRGPARYEVLASLPLGVAAGV
jgi:RNA 2',3'-cyclic 3'-phosphodiesterase